MLGYFLIQNKEGEMLAVKRATAVKRSELHATSQASHWNYFESVNILVVYM